MASNDAFVVGEDWISEHYFTSEARNESFHGRVLARRKAWDAEEAETTRSRFTASRADLERRVGGLTEEGQSDPAAARAFTHDLLDVLGYRTGEFTLDTDGPLTRVSTVGVTGPAPLVLIQATPVTALDDLIDKDAQTLAEPVEQPDGSIITSVARQLSALFVSDEALQFALVLAGRWCLIAEQERWPEGRYLGVDLQLVTERNDTKRGGELDRALACLDAASLAPDADGNIWWSDVLADSVKHTVGVSEDLREGVRRSVEIVANEVVNRRAAQSLPPLPQDQAQVLAVQSLRYLYRILFLLYAEASPELGVLPTGASEYDAGYGIDRLRELTLVELQQESSHHGTHLYASLHQLSRLIDQGHHPHAQTNHASSDALTFDPLRADLFRPEATALIDEVKLGNEAVQRVLQHLLLSKEAKGRDRGFISYVELGINQLGSVYEGLMSYTGFFADEDLFEVAKAGDATKGSWVVPVTRADHLDEKDFVRVEDPETGESQPVRHQQGAFVFRLAGRERQQSASYYTPEVLTRFTVSEALDELLDQDGQTTTAAEILELSVCEPALGSGAFALEAVDQLAREYLRRRQEELGERIDPDDFPTQLQRVKAHIALHQVYGVDLNATAVELAEVSLWLDTMVRGLQAPWFGLRLRRGNSLVGARRATYARHAVNDKSYLSAAPKDVPLTALLADAKVGKVGPAVSSSAFQFLLPASGWGSAVEVPKQVRDLVPEQVAALKAWRSQTKRKLTKTQVDNLMGLTQRVEQLWDLALRRLQIAEQESSRSLHLWGREEPAESSAVTREQIEEALADPDGAYRRLRRVMDAWCALWFWPLTETQVEPPSIDEWLDGLTMLLGRDTSNRAKTRAGQQTFQDLTDWFQLGDAEDDDRIYSGSKRAHEVLEAHPWLAVCEQIASQQGFFHWELDFATVFAQGGFDLQVGNPPWVRPRSDVESLLAEGDPWWQLAHKPSEAQKSEMRDIALAVPGIADLVVNGTSDTVVLAALLGDPTTYPHLAGLQPDLYRGFMSQVWAHASRRGASGLIHPETHLTDERAGLLRAQTYRQLARHWQFFNALVLFEVHDQVSYGVHVYGSAGHDEVAFDNAAGLFHPDTVTRSRVHDGSGEQPGFKHEGKWDLRPHQARIQSVTDETLAVWADVLEDDNPAQTRMVYTVNEAALRTLERLAKADRVGALQLDFSRGWDESIDRKAGRFETSWGPAAWRDAILQGPHLHVSTPFYKSPNATMKHNQDWAAVDLERLAPETTPITAYKPTGDPVAYNANYTHWGPGKSMPARDHYRVAWRAMAANTGERTLISSVIPPGPAHVHGVASAGAPSSAHDLVIVQAVSATLLCDFFVRSAPKSTIASSALKRLPMVPLGHSPLNSLLLRTLRLNCLTDAYADLWAQCWDDAFLDDAPILTQYDPGQIGPEWTAQTPLRRAVDRRNALVENDALVALMLDVPIDDLVTIYRTQFAVLHGYDQRDYTYDINGRLVPNSVLAVWRKKGDAISVDERTATHPEGHDYVYELPFGTLDREADLRTAYAEFERRLADS